MLSGSKECNIETQILANRDKEKYMEGSMKWRDKNNWERP